MYKTLIICALLLAATAVNVRKTHKTVHGNAKHHQKAHHHIENAGFHSAYFELINMGEADYHLDEKVSSHWDQETKDLYTETNNKQSLLEVESEKHHSTIGEVVDLSHAAGVVSYIVMDTDGNVLEAASGPELAQKMKDQAAEIFNTKENSSFIQQDALVDEEQSQVVDPATQKLVADMEQIKKDDQAEQQQEQLLQVSQEEKGDAMVKLETDMDQIQREDEEANAAYEAQKEAALEGTVQQE